MGEIKISECDLAIKEHVADCEKLVRRWKSKIPCERCNKPQVVEEWERSPFHYHIHCPTCKIIKKKDRLWVKERRVQPSR